MVLRPEDYPHSSYDSFISDRGDNIVYRDFVLQLLSKKEKEAKRRYKCFVEAGTGTRLENPLKKIYGGAIAGEDLFVKKVLGKLKNVDIDKAEISNRRQLKSIHKPEEIIKKTSLFFNVSREKVVNSGSGDYRAITIYLIKKYTGLTNKEIGNIFGNLSYSGVSKVHRRFEKKIQKDSNLQRKITKIMSNVKG
jgi:hypothetical protein